jgi:pyruvate/2-oxoglutarate dehydrogenase complex dihydrolipoamide acyltransferase (E2) component
MYTLISYIMVKRSDACNSVTVRIPFKPMHEYILKARKEGRNISHMGMVIAAWVRVVAEFPAMNRFVVNKKVYSHNDFTVGMVVQRPDGAEGTMSKMKFELTDTIDQVNQKINDFVEKNREENSNSTDALMSALLKIPGLCNVAVGLLKWLDLRGWLPRAIIDASPFHGSMVISNLASIRTPHIFHHIYDFGTISQIVTMGTMEDVAKKRGNEITLERYLPLGIVCDERVASGYGYAKAFHRLKEYLAHPELLEVPPEKVVTD